MKIILNRGLLTPNVMGQSRVFKTPDGSPLADKINGFAHGFMRRHGTYYSEITCDRWDSSARGRMASVGMASNPSHSNGNSRSQFKRLAR